ncbi:MAG: 50S ribosomal protein L31 [Chloroflexi bacterium]|nr:50S ribosomal protein L31 [Chloroflexota bacterium]
MKAGIHPKWYPDAQVICACGNTYTMGSTKPVIRTDVCAACHPFYTGEQRIVDTAGQVERFMRRVEAASTESAGGKKNERMGRRQEAREREERSRAAAAAAVGRAPAPPPAEEVEIEIPVKRPARSSGNRGGDRGGSDKPKGKGSR